MQFASLLHKKIVMLLVSTLTEVQSAVCSHTLIVCFCQTAMATTHCHTAKEDEDENYNLERRQRGRLVKETSNKKNWNLEAMPFPQTIKITYSFFLILKQLGKKNIRLSKICGLCCWASCTTQNLALQLHNLPTKDICTFMYNNIVRRALTILKWSINQQY